MSACREVSLPKQAVRLARARTRRAQDFLLRRKYELASAADRTVSTVYDHNDITGSTLTRNET